MDDKVNEPTPQQPNLPVRPTVPRQQERNGSYPFNPDGEDTSNPSVSQTTPVQSAPLTTTTQPRGRKGLLIGLMLTALVILGLGLAYVYWYQNPNKVVSDALLHAVNAKTMTYTGTIAMTGPTKIAVDLEGGVGTGGGTAGAKVAFDVQGKKYTLNGNALVDSKNDLYFKVQNIDSLANNYRQAIPAESQQLFDQIIDKVDDKWVKISSDDLNSYSSELAKAQKCTADAAKKIQTDSNVKSELVEVYKKHPFITIDKSLGAKDGSLGYVLVTDDAKEKTFTNELKSTTVYKALVACDSNLAIKDDVESQAEVAGLDKASTELWVDQWSHQVTRVVINNVDKDQTSTVSIAPKFNLPVAVTTPQGATTLEQLQKDVTELLQSAQSVSAQTAQ